jgi:phenylacetate-CoA ligase
MQLLLNLRAIPLVKLRYSKDMFRYLDGLMLRDSWSYEELMDFVKKEVSHIMKTSKMVPYYKGFSRNGSSIESFPVLSRTTVKSEYSSLINEHRKPELKLFTSGSTGSGLPVFYDHETYMINWAYRMKQLKWAKVDPREWRITFFGSRVVPLQNDSPPFWMTNHPEHQYMASIFHISDKNATHYVKFLENHQGLVVEGFPTVLYMISQYIRSLKGKLHFKAVFSTGEPLYQYMRESIEDAFGAKVFDCYGMTECAGLILECEKGGHHVMLDYGYLEILRENGEQADIGEEGYMTWTGLINKVMPFIRYRIGDRGIWEHAKCPCGRPYPLVKPTITRDSDYLVTSSGRLLSPRAVNQVLKDKVSFKACQFIQEKTDEIVIRIVPDASGSVNREISEVRRELEKMVGRGVVIGELIEKEPLRRGSQGKIPLIVSHIKPANLNIGKEPSKTVNSQHRDPAHG